MAEMNTFVDQGPSWAGMLPEALANIFNRLSFEEKMLVIPRVCQIWRNISQDFVCWQIVDLDRWSSGRSLSTIDRMIKMVVKRSQGSLREFSSQDVGSDATLEFIAMSCPSLQALRIPFSGVTDDGARQIAPRLTCLTDLDISGCASLSKVGLEAFGVHCRSIIRLRRNTYHQAFDMFPSNEEAFTIAQYFPQLKHLELSFASLSNQGLKAVLDNCVSLEYLDLHGCQHLEMDETLIKECKKMLKVFYEPVVKKRYSYRDVLDYLIAILKSSSLDACVLVSSNTHYNFGDRPGLGNILSHMQDEWPTNLNTAPPDPRKEWQWKNGVPLQYTRTRSVYVTLIQQVGWWVKLNKRWLKQFSKRYWSARCRNVWGGTPFQRYNFWNWRMLSGSIPTGDKLRSWPGVSGPCPWCKVARETLIHLLWSCPCLQSFWLEVRSRLRKSFGHAKLAAHMVLIGRVANHSSDFVFSWPLCHAVLTEELWLHKNEVKFQSGKGCWCRTCSGVLLQGELGY